MFRESGFDRKTMPVAYTVVFFSHALDRSVSRIKRIKSHVVFFLPRQRYSRPVHWQSFDLHAVLTRQELLSNIEQARKELSPGSQAYG